MIHRNTKGLKLLVKKLSRKANRQWIINSPIYKAVFIGGYIKGYKAGKKRRNS